MSEAGGLSPLKRAFLALEETEARLRAVEEAAREPIAIVGIGCRLPGGADSPEAFWRLLAEGVDAVGEVPADRFDIDAWYDPDPETPGTISSRYGAFLERVDGFDPQLFGIAPREAVAMDPQQRLALEVAWEAFEDAARAPDALAGTRTGVYVGVVNSDYGQLMRDAGGPEGIDAYYGSGSAHSIVAGRISYVFGLQGPSLAVDTACSASLVAVHLACRGLRSGETDMALAGGVNVILLPETSVALSKLRMLAPDGRCKAFDARADGFVRGEGCALVVLKRLSDALRDGDRIHAVIRGSAVNQDGPTSGLTAPNGPAQEAVLREALADAGLPPADVGYVEAHGTGTALGDPIEVQALAAVLGEGRDPSRPVAVGSVKTNFGHLESAAGIAGLVKAALVLEHREIPPHLHLEAPNPHVPWDRLPVTVPTALAPWPEGAPPAAGVSSFGFSGTNAHVVLAGAPEPAPAPAAAPARPVQLLTLSAADREALGELAGRYEDVLAGAEASLGDVVLTASAGRAQLAHRLALAGSEHEELRGGLAAWRRSGELPARGAALGEILPGEPPKVAFLFTGQGSQHAGMGRALYETEPAFRAVVDCCDELLGGTLLPVLYPPAGESSPIDSTQWSQPALLALEVALAELLSSWGIRPRAVLGHSVGEYAAACFAGVLTVEDALRLVAERGRLMQALPPGGAMAAVHAPEERVRAALEPYGDDLVVACLNGPASVVVSGREAALESLVRELAAGGIDARRLQVSHAFHSPLVEPMLDAFERAAADVELGRPRLRLVPSVTGDVAAAGELADPGYWRRQVREPVRFADAMRTVHGLGCDVFVEIGPHPVLLAMGEACLPEGAGAWLPTLRRGGDDWRTLLETLGALWCRGVEVDWERVHAGRGSRRMRLPTYPFRRRRYWVEAARAGSSRGRARGGHPLLGRRLRSPLPELQFEAEVTPAELPFVADHRVDGASIMPAAGWVELALAAAGEAFGDGRHGLDDLVLREPLTFAGDGARVLHTVVRQDGEGRATLEVQSVDDGSGGWRLHATAVLVRAEEPAARAASSTPEALAEALPEAVAGEAHDEALRERGLAFGSALHGVVEVRRRDGEALARVRLPDAARAGADGFLIHPALLDACLQPLAEALPKDAGGGALWLPVGIDRVRVAESPGDEAWSHVTVSGPAGSAALSCDVRVLDGDGRVLAELAGLRLRPAGATAGGRVAGWLHELAWQDDAGAGDLPEPAALAPALRGRLAELAASYGLAAEGELRPQLDAACAAAVVAALRALGWEPAAGERVAEAALAERLGVVPRHRRLLGRLLAVLAEDGLLSRDGDSWVVTAALPDAEPGVLLLPIAERDPDVAPRIALVGRCAAELADALAGRRDPVDLLFPGGSPADVEAVYRLSREARVLHALAAEAIAGALAGLPEGRRPRLAEVGAGTGATAGCVLPLLPADTAEYLFTDVSQGFLARAAESFAEWPFLRTALLDVERDPAAQGVARESYDVVIAVNVLHATADLESSLAHVRGLLAPGGLLVLLEATAPERWYDVTFGLTDGWWRFADDRTYPLVDRERWRELLERSGFEGVEAVHDATGASRQALFLARAAGTAVRDGSWLVVSDRAGTGERLAELLAAGGVSCAVSAGPGSPDGVRRLVAEAASGASLAGVVYLAALDATGAEPGPDLDSACRGALAVVQALAALDSPPRLWLVTRAGQAAGSADESVAAAQAPLWGLGRVVALEHPELACVRLDLDPADPDPAATLYGELARADAEDEVAYRGGRRRVARLVPAPGAARGDGTAPVRLDVPGTGVLDELRLVAAERGAPGPGEVEIRVHATGLNFRDVLNALAVREDPEPLGSECAGTVVAVGPGVEGLAPGDEVWGVAPGSFATYAIAKAHLLAARPSGLDPAAAATLPMAFMTAAYALERLASLRPGEHVLVHAAAGGVGLAAVQLARLAGATVLATAGSPEKRAFLTALGVEHVMDSRSPAFAGQALAATAGRGVDVVLNSLAGELVDAGLAALGDGGRFLELGKRDLRDPEQVAAAHPGVRYVTVDLGAELTGDTELARELFADLVGRLEAGELEPLPRTTVPLASAAEAFRTMAQARHTGKIVVTQDVPPPLVRRHGSYIVTGGLAGLGLAVAGRLAERGAGQLVLLGRNDPDEAARARIRELERAGTRVEVLQGDVADRDAVERAVAAAESHGARLRGVVHSAGVLDDAVLANQDWTRFAAVLAPKVAGAWNLHEATAGRELDWLCLFSSAAALLGSPGQGNHAAANAYLDALAHGRRLLGLPAVAVNWGAWSEIGAAAVRGVVERVAERGVEPIPPREGLDAFELAVASRATQLAVLPVDWARYLAGRASVPPRLAALATAAPAAGTASQPPPGAAGVRLRETLSAAPRARRRELLLAWVAEQAARVLALDADAVHERRPLQELGLDSLMAVELRNALGAGLGLERPLPATLVFDFPTISAISDYLEKDVLGLDGGPEDAGTADDPENAADLLEAIQRLSDEEVERRLSGRGEEPVAE